MNKKNYLWGINILFAKPVPTQSIEHMLTFLPFPPTLLHTLFKTSICKSKFQCGVGLEWDLHLKFTPKIILNYSIFSYLCTHTPPLFFHILTSACGLFQKVNTNRLVRWVCILLLFFCGRRKLIYNCKSYSLIPLTRKKYSEYVSN